jgi:signal transduction histidine kinase
MPENGFSRVIHDLRSSLTSVRSLTEILQDYPDINDEKRSEFLNIIIHEAERMNSIIQQAESPFPLIPETVRQLQNTNA